MKWILRDLRAAVDLKPLSSTVVGSYPQPDWLIDREALGSHSVPRVRASHAWRIPEAYLQAAQDDATLLAIRDMERAGIDTITCMRSPPAPPASAPSSSRPRRCYPCGPCADAPPGVKFAPTISRGR